MVTGAFCTMITLPRIFGSRLNLFFQEDQLTIATGGARPVAMSSGPISRPAAGFTPSTEKKLPLTDWPVTVSGSSPSPRTLKEAGVEPAIKPEKTWL